MTPILAAAVQQHAVDSRILERLAAALRCQWATYWKVDPERLCLAPDQLWALEEDRTQALYTDTVGKTLSLSQGNAGHVWRSRKPIWAKDLVLEMCLPRSLGARASGFSGGIRLAVKTDTVVYGVLEFLGKDIDSVSEETLVVIEQFGFALGHVLEKVHLEGK